MKKSKTICEIKRRKVPGDEKKTIPEEIPKKTHPKKTIAGHNKKNDYKVITSFIEYGKV